MNLKSLHILIIIACFTTCVGVGHAQIQTKPWTLAKLDRKTVYFGFHIGFNTMNLGIRPVGNPAALDSIYKIESKAGSGFSMGILTNVRLHEYIALRAVPSISFGGRTLLYTEKFQGDTKFREVKKNIESTYLELPVLLRLKSARLNDVRLYIETGFKYSFDLSSKAGTDDSGENLVKLKKHNYSFELGTGIDIYLKYFKFTPSVRVGWGLNNALYKEDHIYSGALNKAYNRTILVAFYFEGSL